MRRALVVGITLAVVGTALGGLAYYGLHLMREPILVGLLHSQHGMFASVEKAMIDGELLAIEEINAEGGLLGRQIKPVIADGRSEGSIFAQQAIRLITVDRVSAIFGCYASSCRKTVKPILEEHDHLLFYAAAYEGLEESPNIIYTGGPANQQVFPALSWCLEKLKARKFFLLGSDSVWPRAVNELSKDLLKTNGAQVVSESYLLPGATDLGPTIEALKKAAPDVVICSLEGDSNAPFYEELRRAGITADKLPVVSFTITEEDLRSLPTRDMIGHYSAWNYFQSLDTQENQVFVRNFKAKYGADRVTCDSVSTAYNSVRLWAQAVTEAHSIDVSAIRPVIRRQSLDAPEGIITVDPLNLHDWRPFYMGKVGPDGQFEVVWTMPKSILPVPFPTTRPKSEWESFLNDLYTGWGGNWANPEKGIRGRPAG